MKVLIVDDMAINRVLLGAYMSKNGFEYHHASNGLEALEKVVKFNPDIILSDLEMPIMDGFEFLLRLKEVSSIPVIIVSSLTDEETATKCIHHGAYAFIQKPVAEGMLMKRITEVQNNQYELLQENNKIEETTV